MNRIKELREQKGLSQAQLGVMVGRDQTLISKLENGHIDFDMTMADKLSEIFDVPLSNLRIGLPKNKRSILNTNLLQPRIAESMDRTDFGPDMLPILGYANASSSATMLSFDEPLGYEPRHPNQRGIKNAFFLKVYDESMMPRYNPEERVAVNGSTMPLPKKDCIVEMANGERYLKQFIKITTKEIICRQFNPDREWKRPIEEVKAIHAVVGGVW